LSELRLIDRDVSRYTITLLQSWKAVAEDWARHSLGKTSQVQHETESQRKMRKILAMKGARITLRDLTPPQHSLKLGRVRNETAIIVEDCDEDTVRFQILESGTKKSLPLAQILIGHDDQQDRPALEHKTWD